MTQDEYYLKPHCFLVEGFKRAAIYDLKNRKVFSINEIGKRVLRGELEDGNYWRKLVELKLADKGKTKKKLELKKIRPLLKFMWLEVTGRCNLKCLHCYGRFGEQKETRDDLVNWQNVLEQGRKLGCKIVQFIGGEPLLHPGLKKLIIKARELGFKKIEVFSNLTLFNEDWADFFKKYNVFLAVSCYSCQPDIHDSITQGPGSFKKTDSAIKLAKKKNLHLRVSLIGMKQNQKTLNATGKYFEACGVLCHPPDVVRPTGRAADQDLLPNKKVMLKYVLKTKPSFVAIPSLFWRSHQFNSCWFGKIAITPTGDVIPCIMGRHQIGGNVNKESLSTIVDKMASKFWRISLDQVEVCQDCEYRYACRNCRPLSESTYKNLFAKNPRCYYNPYTGIWHKSPLKRTTPPKKGGDRRLCLKSVRFYPEHQQ